MAQVAYTEEDEIRRYYSLTSLLYICEKTLRVFQESLNPLQPLSPTYYQASKQTNKQTKTLGKNTKKKQKQTED